MAVEKKPVKKRAVKPKIVAETVINSDPSALRDWVKENGTVLQLNGYDATIEAAVANGWKPV